MRYNRFNPCAPAPPPAACAILPLLLALFIAHALPAQDTLYYDSVFNPVHSAGQAYYLELHKCAPADTNRCMVLTYLAQSGSLVSVMKYGDYAGGVLDGRCTYWYPNGTVCREAAYKDGMLQGAESIYYPNNQLKRKLLWDHDTLVSGTFFNEDGTPKSDVYQEDLNNTEWMVPPSFPGGQDSLFHFFYRTLRYPAEARENNIQGRVLISFVVDRDGALSEIKVAEPVSPLLDREALYLVGKMPRWLPGRINGLPVRVRFMFPVVFRLE